MKETVLFVWTFGLFLPLVSAQILTTKCLTDWTKYKERCYLVPVYRHSWHRALGYCQKYGAKLVQPTGYVINDQIRDYVTAALPDATSYWTGYHRPDISQPAYSAQWSDGQSTSSEVGVWGLNEPNTATGQFAFVSTSDSRWYMGDPGVVRNFVCEMDPCPSGTRDTYMCNGKCLKATNVLCNGVNDCGNNQDENNCASVSGGDCTREYEGTSGSITLPSTNDGFYQASLACSWTVKAPPNERIALKWMDFETEPNTDFMEIWDGGLTGSTSQLAARWSGMLTGHTFISSYNFVTLRFVSDSSVQFAAGYVTWKTGHDCRYEKWEGYSYSNKDIEFDTTRVPTIKTTDMCKEECNETSSCTGFRYEASVRTCYFLNRLPVLQPASGSELWMKTCFGDTTVQGGVPLLPWEFEATPLPKHLSTPLYPGPPVGNMELEYVITAYANNLITLEVLYLDLCCDDNIYIYDKDRDLLATLTSDSTTDIILSTSNTVYITMELIQPWQCNGALLEITQGCNITKIGSGTIRSPGFGTTKSYPDLMNCTWTLYAPSEDRSLTALFEDFDLDEDVMQITTAAGEVSSHTGTSLFELSRTEKNNVTLTMITGSRDSGRGFNVSFSPGCPVLDAAGYVVSPHQFDFGARVNLSCAAGYMFSSDYSQKTYLTLTCERGGHWSIDNIPACVQGKCCPPPFVANGYIVSSSGSVGGSVTDYMCNTNYTLEGSASITCMADGSWEDPPTCASAALCQSIANLAPTVNADVLWLDGELHGSVVGLSCGDDKEIIGAQTVQCNVGTFDFSSDTDPSYCNPIPCETPVVPHAALVPEPEYGQGQEIAAACVEGFVMDGAANFRCGGNDTVPKCSIKNCSLSDFDLVIPGDGSGRMKYSYGDDVNVTCEDGYYLENISTSHMMVTCLHTGNWSHTPSCGKPNCGDPYAVSGSAYSPAVGSVEFCYEHGCSFTFQCRARYQQFGNSSVGNTTVTCGAVYDGLWDFGDLRCIGGQCPDPGYPASGWLVDWGSFEEFANATFACADSGYEPLTSLGQVSDGMTCTYNATSMEMEWVGEMPECNDTQAPTVFNCEDGTVRYTAEMLTPLTSVIDPSAVDNNAVGVVEHYPENTWLDQPYDEATTIRWTFTDFNGNSAYCTINVIVPASIDCKNDISTNLALTTDTNVSVESYVGKKFSGARVVYDPEEFNVQATAASLDRIFQAEVTSFNGDSNEILDKCTVQLRYSAPQCANWAFDIPNGVKDCTGNTCNITCNTGSYFMEDPALSFITMTCDSLGWSRDPPVCAETTESYLIYRARYEYKYFIQGGVSDTTMCINAYLPVVHQDLTQFAEEMEDSCNEYTNNINPVDVTLLTERTELKFTLDTQRLTVFFEFLIAVTDDTLNGATAVKETCASNVIQSTLNTEISVASVLYSLDDVTDSTLTCRSGVYDLSSGTTQYGYDCDGYRRLQPYERLCLYCHVGSYYDSTTEPYNCKPCPSGTYGVQSADGAMCQTCPEGKNPGLTGQTSASSCDFKEACPSGYFSFDGLKPCKACPIGYYSTEPYSRTCISCGSDKVTYNTSSTSIIDCKSLEEAVTDNAITPCTRDNPCMNGGTCGFVRSDYNCTCPPGYTGRRCETTFNLCTSNPCKNGKTCVTTAGSPNFTCICSTDPSSDSELSGNLCEIDTFGCAESFCNNNGTCHNQFQSHSCKCPTYSGYRNEDGTCSTKIDPCEVAPQCEHGTCIPNSHFYKTCDCDPGWTGIYCENNVDDCVWDFCENGATCVDGVNSFTCACADGFFGHYCQFRISCDRKCNDEDDEFCHTCNDDNTYDCISVNNDFICECLPGYAGRSCEVATSICKSFPCKHGGTCTAVNETTFSCDCMHPWTGDQCERQINNCPNGTQCYNGGTCYSTSSGYRCECPEGYRGDSCSERYDLCARANPCVADGSNCSFSAGVFHCSCPTGYTGDCCENILASCTADTCENGGTCTDTADGATCSCPAAFSGATCNMEIDACLSDPCSTNQECVNGVGMYTCTCAVGYRGPNCEKEVGVDFDYVITPVQLCREDASVAVFGDGETDIDELSIAFWARYTVVHGEGVLLNVLGSKSGGTEIPASPDFHLTFYPSRVDAFVGDTSASRRKRETEDLDYPRSVADGYWHHLVVTWFVDTGDLTLYVDGSVADQVVFSENSPVANIGFIVFGAIDPVVGTTVPEESFEGRVSRVYVVNTELSSSDVQRLYARSFIPTGVLLHPERTTMQMYPVEYNSELNINRNKCVPSDTDCNGLNTVADVPELNSCPPDAIVVAERGVRPNWTVPEYSGSSTTVISNYVSGGSDFDHGIHGIAYAGFDAQGDATTCTFNLFYREAACEDVDGDNAACVNIEHGGKRCSGDCPTDESLTGILPLNQICSMYGMWDEEVKYTNYIFPDCTAATSVTQRVTLDLTVIPSDGTCDDIKQAYSSAVLNKLNQLNQQTNSALCSTNCGNVLSSAFSCDDNNIDVSIDFGILSSTMAYGDESVTPEELLKIAVGDYEAFDYLDASNTTVSPDLSTFSIVATPECAAGYMVSSGKCVLCGKGTYYDASSKTCKRCAIGSYRSDLTNVVSSCSPCHSNFTTPTDGAQDNDYCITRCVVGRYYEIPTNPNVPPSGGTCRSCAVGYYQDGTSGSITCKPCPVGLTTARQGSTSVSNCVTPESLTTTSTTPGATPGVGAATEGGGLSVGVIVAVVLGVIFVLAVIILIICFCCCKESLPCLSKKKQVVSPVVKDGYYAKKYGDVNMHFVSYNLQDVREKKGKPLDRVPFVEPPLSDETGSVRTDISVHVPVFIEKIGGKVKRKSLYMSNGGQTLNASLPRSGRTPRDPVMTSSPRQSHYENEMEEEAYVQPKQKRRRRRHRKDRSSSEKRSRRRYEEEEMEPVDHRAGGPLPKALAPMPHRLVSKPPDDVILRPSSPLDQPRVQVLPAQYEDFLEVSPTRGLQGHRSPHSSRSRDKERSRSRSGRRPQSFDGDEVETMQQYSGRYYEEEQPSFHVKRIEVESDEDLR